MTLVEFIYPVRKRSISDQCLSVLYFEQRYNNRLSLTVGEIRTFLKRARMPRATKANLADILAKSAPYIDVVGKKGKCFLWAITTSGQQYVRTIHKLPEADVEIEHDVSALNSLLRSISDKYVADYIRESIKCLSIGALRAAVVFLWSGAVQNIRQTVLKRGFQKLNSAIIKYDAKSRKVRRLDDFVYIKDSVLLFVAQDIGVFDKNERGILEDALDLRNKCGHPGKYKLGPKKVSSFIEDIVGIIW